MRLLAAALLVSPVLLTARAAAQQPLYDLQSPEVGSEFGSDIAALGDIDGDGLDDFAIGAPMGDGLQIDSGVVQAFSGADASLIWTSPGETSGDRFGHALILIEDRDGDGYCDLVVGAPLTEDTANNLVNCGAVFYVSGKTGQVTHREYGSQTGEQFGFDLVNLGPEYAVSAPYWDADPFNTNVGRLHYITPSNLLGGGVVGQRKGDLFGYALADSGIINLVAGTRDVLVSSPGFDLVGPIFTVLDAGMIQSIERGVGVVYSTTGTGGDRLGESLSGGLDLSGDGVPDFVAGAPDATLGGEVVGRVSAYAASFFGPSLLWTTYGTADGDELGRSVALIDDVTGDGVPDVVVGAPGFDYGTYGNAGRASIISGADGQIVSSIYGYEPGVRMGDVVGVAGHVNADPWPDPVGCAPNSNGEFTGGLASILLGNASAPSVYCTAKVNSAGCLPEIDFDGCPSDSVSSDDFQVTAWNVLDGKPGIMIWSLTAAATPFYGGTLCVQAPIKRTPLQTATTGTSTYPCAGFYSFDFDRSYRQQKGIFAGDTVYCQYWSRDSGFAPPNGIGLTAGLQVTVHP